MAVKKSKNNLFFEPLLIHCPLCSARYNPYEARVIENKDGNNLLHSQCQKCGAFIISLVTATPFGISSIGIISDLTAADVLRFKNQPKITCDDVLEFHQVITKSQNG